MTEVSTAGIFVQTPAPPPLDSEVEVFLRLGDTKWHATGHVVQVVSCERATEEARRPGYGLLFTHISDAERDALRDALRDAIESARKTRVRETPSQRPAPVREVVEPAKLTSVEVEAQAQALIDKLRSELRELAQKPAWAVLGIAQSSTPEEAKAAFFAAGKRYHPHLFSRYASPEITQTVTELFIAHKRAYSTMAARAVQTARTNQPLVPSTPQPPAEPSVAQPVSSLRATAAEPSGAPRPAKSNPATHPAKGSDVFTSRPPMAAGQADQKKSRAAELDMVVAAALRHIAAARLEEAESELDRALALDPLCTNARIWRLVVHGRQRKAEGDLGAAHAKYLEVLTLDPEHHEALSETKKLAKDGRDKPAGLLGRLFGSRNK